MRTGWRLSQILFLGLWALTLACGPRPVPGPEAADLRPEEVARAFAAAVLERGELAEAMRWAEPQAALGVRSQVGFLGQDPSGADYQVGAPTREADSWKVSVRIEALEVAGHRFQGEMELSLAPDGRRVRNSSLVLERADKVRFSL